MILGVTGTLDQLLEHELKIIKYEYDILNFTFLPSVYGTRGLARNGVHISNKSRYYLDIIDDINEQMVSLRRPVIVFFKSDAAL